MACEQAHTHYPFYAVSFNNASAITAVMAPILSIGAERSGT